jgi:hypothetical protein
MGVAHRSVVAGAMDLASYAFVKRDWWEALSSESEAARAQGKRYRGNTLHGAYMCKKEADVARDRQRGTVSYSLGRNLHMDRARA